MSFNSLLASELKEEIKRISPLSGGDINEVYLVMTGSHTYVLKRNRKDAFPQMFEKEAKGLAAIAEVKAVSPSVIRVFSDQSHQYLVLERIIEERPGKDFWNNFGEHLALLHRKQNETFGLGYHNYIGSLVQYNEPKSTWTDFFGEVRLQYLARRAYDRRLFDRGHLKSIENLIHKLPELIPEESPSLLHGDLWSGNLLCGAGQLPVFIDPAIYFGHREVDIAMTKMFGGFDPAYLHRYHEIFPLEPGWEERIDLHNLYPNMVHLLLFGRAYLGNIERVFHAYS